MRRRRVRLGGFAGETNIRKGIRISFVFGSSTSVRLAIVIPGSYFQFPLALVEPSLDSRFGSDWHASHSVLALVFRC